MGWGEISTPLLKGFMSNEGHGTWKEIGRIDARDTKKLMARDKHFRDQRESSGRNEISQACKEAASYLAAKNKRRTFSYSGQSQRG